MRSETVAFIFARGGSKGIPRKNLQTINGMTLLAHAIGAALAVPKIARVIVSTDCSEIADEALRNGAEVPFIRPAELASDQASEFLAWKHAVRYLRTSGAQCDVFVSLPPTSPLRTPNDIEKCINYFETGDHDLVLTVCEAQRNPYFNMIRLANDHDNVSLAFSDGSRFVRRQDAPRLYDITTVAYVSSPAFIETANSIFEGRVGAVLIPRERAIDIDDEFDLRVARALSGQESCNLPAELLKS